MVAARRDLSAGEAEEAMAVILSGSASTAQIAAFLVALRMKGETVGGVVGLARAMRRDGRADRVRPGRRPAARYLRNRRRRSRHVQHFDDRGVCGAGAGVRRGQARQPVDFQPVRQRGRAGAAGGENYHRAAADGARGPRSGDRLSVRAGRSSRHEARASGARGAENADGVQPAGTVDQPGRRRMHSLWARPARKPPG